MANELITSHSGRILRLVYGIETREIYLAQGIERHESDFLYWQSQEYDVDTTFQYLSREIGDEFRVRSDTLAEYTSTQQRVHYIIRIIHSKDEFKNALETEGIHVVYNGHSRYGRGACFDVYSNHANQRGEQWEQGINNNNGIFRLGYPYIGIPFEDIEHHQYHFAPVPIENDVPPRSHRHPHARRQISRKTLPESLRELAHPDYRSESNRYWGFTRRGKIHILLHAGWENTLSNPYDLGVTILRCRVFCHFGCSSRIHFWRIVRRPEYKGWVRPSPPTDRYAYFTTAPSDEKDSLYWLYYVLKYPHQNSFEPWWNSLQWAKRRTNRKLRSEGAAFRIY